jgi:hypothetical protein
VRGKAEVGKAEVGLGLPLPVGHAKASTIELSMDPLPLRPQSICTKLALPVLNPAHFGRRRMSRDS